MSVEIKDEMSVDQALFNEEPADNTTIDEPDELEAEKEPGESNHEEEPDTGETDWEVEAKAAKAEADKYRAINKKLEAKNKKNYERLKELEAKGEDGEIEVQLTEEEDALKYEDPDKYAKLYAKKLREAEKKRDEEKSKKTQQVEVAEQIDDAMSDLREQYKDFDKIMLNDQGILNVDHIPPAKLREWVDKGLTIKEQVEAAYLLLSGAKPKNPKTMDQPSLGDMGGSSKPTGKEKKGDDTYDKLM